MTDESLLMDTAPAKKEFPPHPAGPFAAIICDVFNLGSRVKQWTGEPARLSAEVAIIFRTHELREDGQPFELARRFTKSFGEKANLRKFVQSFLGRVLVEKERIDIGKLPGKPCLINVVHTVTKQGRTRADVQTIMPLPKGMMAPTLASYTRAPYWETVIAAYAAETAQFERGHASFDPNEFEEVHDDA